MTDLKCDYADYNDTPCKGTVTICVSMTAYHWDKEADKPDPNAPFPCCEEHYEQYCDHWTEQWNIYNSSRG